MNKKIIATVLSTLFLFNSAHASGTTKSDTHTLIKYFLLGAGASVVAILPPTAILISGTLKGSNSTNTTTKTESECNIKSWNDVADLYFKAAKAEKIQKARPQNTTNIWPMAIDVFIILIEKTKHGLHRMMKKLLTILKKHQKHIANEPNNLKAIKQVIVIK